MSRLFAVIFVLCLCTAPSFAQATDTTICDVLAHPANFDGKTVRIKGQVIAGFDQFQLQDYKCTDGAAAIWLSYPEGTKVKSGPVATVSFQLSQNNPNAVAAVNRTPVQLVRDQNFKTFDTLLSTPYKGKAVCLGCTRNTVNATLIGRLDVSEKTGIQHDTKGQITGVAGFGNMNLYNVRLVIASVAEVTPEEIDYSKVPVETATVPLTQGDTPLISAQRAAAAYPAESMPSTMLQQAIDAFGKPKENNGVVVAFGHANEARSDESAKSNFTSPDGLAVTVTIDKERVKMLPAAYVHLGIHIADLRNPQGDAKQEGLEIGFYESRGVYLATGELMGSGQKEVILPGGYESWNSTWKPEQATDQMNKGISQTLAWANERMN